MFTCKHDVHRREAEEEVCTNVASNERSGTLGFAAALRLIEWQHVQVVEARHLEEASATVAELVQVLGRRSVDLRAVDECRVLVELLAGRVRAGTAHGCRSRDLQALLLLKPANTIVILKTRHDPG